MPIPKELTEKLKEFLAERRESDGDYATVTQKDMEQLYEVMYAVVEAKWGADCDGDRPINFQIIDRTRFEPLHFRPVPYRHHAEGFKNPLARQAWEVEVMDRCISNAKTAMDRLDTEARITQNHRLESQKQQATFKQGDRFICVGVKPEDEDCLTVDKEYEADGHSWWRSDVEMVRVVLDDQDKRWNSYPISYFELESKSGDTAKPA